MENQAAPDATEEIDVDCPPTSESENEAEEEEDEDETIEVDLVSSTSSCSLSLICTVASEHIDIDEKKEDSELLQEQDHRQNYELEIQSEQRADESLDQPATEQEEELRNSETLPSDECQPQIQDDENETAVAHIPVELEITQEETNEDLEEEPQIGLEIEGETETCQLSDHQNNATAEIIDEANQQLEQPVAIEANEVRELPQSVGWQTETEPLEEADVQSCCLLDQTTNQQDNNNNNNNNNNDNNQPDEQLDGENEVEDPLKPTLVATNNISVYSVICNDVKSNVVVDISEPAPSLTPDELPAQEEEEEEEETLELAERIRRLSQQLSSIPDEDLEREFDEEPDFERHHVELRRDCDPRDHYELHEELGRGKFGTVFKCTQRHTGRQLAAKFIHLTRNEDREDVEREIAIMSLLQHKRLLQLFDAFQNGTNEMCLITELVAGGELFERVVDNDFDLTERKAAIFMRQICEGVEYMHSQSIVHLDMKPENILCVSRTGNRIKLIDFGLARQLNPSQPLRVMFGTPDFAAPEVLGYETVTLATDMWSVGVICYVLLSGLSPFMGDNDLETMANVTRATFDFDDQAFEPISELAKDFIAKLLVREPDKRLDSAACLRHAWLQRGGAQIEASVRERRESNVSAALAASEFLIDKLERSNSGASLVSTIGNVASLNKRNLKRYVVRRKWHKSVHAIMALSRMGAFRAFN